MLTKCCCLQPLQGMCHRLGKQLNYECGRCYYCSLKFKFGGVSTRLTGYLLQIKDSRVYRACVHRVHSNMIHSSQNVEATQASIVDE